MEKEILIAVVVVIIILWLAYSFSSSEGLTTPYFILSFKNGARYLNSIDITNKIANVQNASGLVASMQTRYFGTSDILLYHVNKYGRKAQYFGNFMKDSTEMIVGWMKFRDSAMSL